MRGVRVMTGLEPLDQVALLVAELGGDAHRHMGHQIAALAIGPQPCNAESLECHRVLRLAPGGNRDVLRAVEGLDLQIVPQHGPSHRHLNPAVQVIAVARVLLVGFDTHVDIQVAGGAAALADLALVGQAQP